MAVENFTFFKLKDKQLKKQDNNNIKKPEKIKKIKNKILSKKNQKPNISEQKK